MYLVSDKDWQCDRCGKKHLQRNKNGQHFIYHTYNVNSHGGFKEVGSYTLCIDCLNDVFNFIKGDTNNE